MTEGYTRVVPADQFEAFVRPLAEELYRAAFNAGLEEARQVAIDYAVNDAEGHANIAVAMNTASFIAGRIRARARLSHKEET